MPDTELTTTIVENVLRSKKYKSLYAPTAQRVVEELTGKYSDKDLEQAVKKKLHQVYGAFLTNPNYKKLLEQVNVSLTKGASKENIVANILKLQSSTAERAPFITAFYQKIFEHTGLPKSICEPACGLNALTYLYMGKVIKYTGYDVDTKQMEFINKVFALLGLDSTAHVEPGDIFITQRQPSEVTFYLKTLALLEHQKKGCSLPILKQTQSRFIVVSYPTKSLTGKDKGMEEYYSEYFTKLISQENWRTAKILFPNELVFVIDTIAC